MTYGITTITNSASEILIDQEYRALEVIQEGSLTAPGGSFNNLLTLDYSDILLPMVFIKMLVDVRYFFGPTTATRFWIGTNQAAGTPVEYKLCGFRADDTASPGGKGSRINRRGSAEIAFTNRRKYLRLINALQVIYFNPRTVIRAGDGFDFDTSGSGAEDFYRFDHPTKPIPLATYWLATLTGLGNRTNSVNSDPWVMERKSTTRLEYHLDFDNPIDISARTAMGLADGTGYNVARNHLIAA